jgi:tRNA (mo5U34)-methyltransferase
MPEVPFHPALSQDFAAADSGYSETMAVVNELNRFELVRRWDNERTERGWWHSFEMPDGTTIPGVCSVESLRNRIGQFPIPQDLRGKRVLDIGAWDGWFSFEMERRGAEVLAIDNWDNPRFHEARAMLNSRVEYRQMDMYELTPERVGRFDIVLFMGVLYHLKHPLLALERVCALTTDLAAVDSFVLREEHRPGADVSRRPVMEFYETSEFGGQTDNWVAPSLSCLEAFCRTAGFARVELRGELENSACFACYRHWESPRADAPEGPELVEVVHNLNHGINFDSSRDELVTIWFRWKGRTLGVGDVQPEVGGYGVRPIYVKQLTEIGWQTNFKLPPGLTPGWHQASLRVDGSRASASQRVAVDLPLVTAEVQIRGMCDSKTWLKDQLDRSAGDVLSVWIAGLPENVDRNNLNVSIAGRRAWVAYIGADEGGARQINVEVPKDLPAGPAVLTVSIGSSAPSGAGFEIIQE